MKAFYRSVRFCVAVAAHKLQIVFSQGNSWVCNILRGQRDLVVYDLSRRCEAALTHHAGFLAVRGSHLFPGDRGVEVFSKVSCHLVPPGVQLGHGLALCSAGYHLRGKNKNAGANNIHDQLVLSLAPALYALAFDIQDHFRFAAAAVNRKVSCGGLLGNAKQLFVGAADWANNPSIYHFDYTTSAVAVQ